MISQRYISQELTHFVGRGLTRKEQYERFVKILKQGLVRPKQYFPGAHTLTVSRRKRFSANTMYNPDMVCFCDIPIADFDIHIKKYSPFGISFLKPFLIKKGANPVFYISRNSFILTEGTKGVPSHEYFDKMMKKYHKIITPMISDLAKNYSGQKGEYEDLFKLNMFLEFHFFSFAKCFDNETSDASARNYYMEREWRVLGGINFKLKDVNRVLLPKRYAKKFHNEFPEFEGQINYV